MSEVAHWSQIISCTVPDSKDENIFSQFILGLPVWHRRGSSLTANNDRVHAVLQCTNATVANMYRKSYTFLKNSIDTYFCEFCIFSPFFRFLFNFSIFPRQNYSLFCLLFFYLSNGTQPRIFGPIFKLAHQTSKFIMRQKSYTYKWISHILQEKPWFVDGKKIVQILRDVSVMFGLSACSRYPINLSPAECWSCFQK